MLRLAVCCSHASWWLKVYNGKNKPDMFLVIDLCCMVDACRQQLGRLFRLGCFCWFSLCRCSFLYFSSASLYSLPALTLPHTATTLSLCCRPLFPLSIIVWAIVAVKPPLISASLSLVLFFFCCAVPRTASCWKYVSPLPTHRNLMCDIIMALSSCAFYFWMLDIVGSNPPSFSPVSL